MSVCCGEFLLLPPRLVRPEEAARTETAVFGCYLLVDGPVEVLLLSWGKQGKREEMSEERSRSSSSSSSSSSSFVSLRQGEKRRSAVDQRIRRNTIASFSLPHERLRCPTPEAQRGGERQRRRGTKGVDLSLSLCFLASPTIGRRRRSVFLFQPRLAFPRCQRP